MEAVFEHDEEDEGADEVASLRGAQFEIELPIVAVWAITSVRRLGFR